MNFIEVCVNHSSKTEVGWVNQQLVGGPVEKMLLRYIYSVKSWWGLIPGRGCSVYVSKARRKRSLGIMF